MIPFSKNIHDHDQLSLLFPANIPLVLSVCPDPCFGVVIDVFFIAFGEFFLCVCVVAFD